MNSQLLYLIVQQRHIELAYRAEQARLAGEARAAVSAPSRRGNLGRLLATRQLWATGLAPAATQASPGPPQECLRCDK
jgi:hypothetical protein